MCDKTPEVAAAHHLPYAALDFDDDILSPDVAVKNAPGVEFCQRLQNQA